MDLPSGLFRAGKEEVIDCSLVAWFELTAEADFDGQGFLVIIAQWARDRTRYICARMLPHRSVAYKLARIRRMTTCFVATLSRVNSESIEAA